MTAAVAMWPNNLSLSRVVLASAWGGAVHDERVRDDGDGGTRIGSDEAGRARAGFAIINMG